MEAPFGWFTIYVKQLPKFLQDATLIAERELQNFDPVFRCWEKVKSS